MNEILYEKVEGKRGVRIERDEFGLSLSTMRNGYQWSGFPVDEEMIRMMAEAFASLPPPPKD